jgi:hypothetical protein
MAARHRSAVVQECGPKRRGGTPRVRRVPDPAVPSR